MLVITGGEALYADMGHFGIRPIRAAWLLLVFPALLLNYFGQGALLVRNPAAVENPFFLLAPKAMILPLVWLAYTLVRGVVIGAYPYPFIDVVRLGYGQVAINVGAIVVFAVVLTHRSTDDCGTSPLSLSRT